VPKSFPTVAAFRAWLLKHHDKETELMARLYRNHARARGIGYREALDELLCFGWIDGVRRSLDDDSFVQRFTPRKAKSNWSNVNIKRFKELKKEGRVHPAGLAAFEAWDGKPAPYSFQSKTLELDPAFLGRLRAHKTTWANYQKLAPGYKRVTLFWVMSAKKPETRERRFETLLERMKQGKKIGLLEPKPKK
jgi:uncharacterized protein YdeI (YjbR/CyaY-like superfamily)